MKVLLANPCGKIADTVFDAHAVAPLDAWYGTAAYALQILFDFSGYSEMAVGLGLMMGFVFAKNFDTPYQSQSITEFWRRWHISLSTWLRDYLYIPLGGNRRGEGRTYANLLITMLLGGLWHGAAWNFLIWGGLHGCALACERYGTRQGWLQRWPRPVRLAWTLSIVLLGWVFFRARDLPTAFAHLHSMSGLRDVPQSVGLVGGVIYQPYYVVCFAVATVAACKFPSAWAWTQSLSGLKACVCIALLWIALIMLATQEYNPFIYFIF
jgi:alginate O-acetyltransferase complex protein AlgI